MLAMMCVTLAVIASGQGEGFIDIYGGRAATDGGTIKGEVQYVSIFGSTDRESFSSSYGRDESYVFGARLGWWLDSVPWLGFALDGSYFDVEPTADNLDLNVFVLTPMTLARYALFRSEEYPNGRLQPYVAIGPAFALVNTSFSYDDGGEQTDVDDIADAFGLDVRSGCVLMCKRTIGFFIEYRYTNILAESDPDDDQVFLGGQIDGIDTRLTTSHIVGGITFRY